VKRAKKAEATKGVVQESSALSGKEIHKESNGKAHKPDLTQISKGLPDGWQVCEVLLLPIQIYLQRIIHCNTASKG
jgi:hypothetical protein